MVTIAPVGKLFIAQGEVIVTRDGGWEHWEVDGKSMAKAAAHQLGIDWVKKELNLGNARLYLEKLE